MLHSELDILCVAETKLIGEDVLNIAEYTWLGHNRLQLHRNAWAGSGGVGILVRNTLLRDYSVSVLDKTCEGILWIQFKGKENAEDFNVCVCYLPPEGSTRNVDAEEYFETLLSQVYCYQDKLMFICGDFNSRLADIPDFIEGVDEVPERDVIDFRNNAHGMKMIDFLLSSNCCVLNGRPGISVLNDFTSVSVKGLAVVDYCVVPYENLHRFSDFKVVRSTDLFNSAGCLNVVDPSHCMPDHSMLKWCVEVGQVKQTLSTNNPVSTKVTQFSRDVPPDFLSDNLASSNINNLIEQIQTQEAVQNNIDSNYEDFCSLLKQEMEAKLSKKTVTITSGQSNKRRKMRKPWWNEELTDLWQKRCQVEKAFTRSVAANRTNLKAEVKAAGKSFDRAVQRSKRQYWRKCQEDLSNLNSKDPREFWKKFGQISIASERKHSIPWEVVLSDGSVSNAQMMYWSDGGLISALC